jgi:membrane-bound lytic murein transglycosylase D
VPQQLRARVDFWKDIFTKYGTAQSVIHHRDFPQIVFGVIDLSNEFGSMSRAAFDSHKSGVVNRTLDDVKRQLLELSESGRFNTEFQQRVQQILEERGLERGVLRNWVEQDLIRTQTGIRERYGEAVRRAWRYLPVMEQIFVQEFGLPRELTRLPFIESSFDYTAYSSVGAAGIWQFMPRTARAHRMSVGRYVDERRDPIKATRAAAEYLRSAYNSLGSWPLAVTSYNHGVGGVRAKVRKAGSDDLAKILEDPNERYFGFASTNFFPEFLAAVEIFRDPQAYFPEINEEPPLQLVSYPLRKPVGAASLSSKLGISVADLREANYALLDPVWSGRAAIPAGYAVRVPVAFKDRADNFFSGKGVGYTHSGVQSAELREDGSKLIGVEGARIERAVFKTSNGSHLGQERGGVHHNKIAAKKGGAKDKIVTSKVRPAPKKVSYVTVSSGDTLGSIAKRHGVSVEQIRSVNRLRGSYIVKGQRIRLP